MMKYALCLADDGRILSVTFSEYASETSVLVDTLPEGPSTDYKYIDGEYVYDPQNTGRREEIQNRILDLKQKLYETDYNIIKIMEGAATVSDMQDVISKRSKWRQEINELEKELG